VLSGLDGPAGLGDTELLACGVVSPCSHSKFKIHPALKFSITSPISQ
jgi:hypothetical protein